MGGMAHEEWGAMESLPEIEFLRSGVDGWEGLRQHAIGSARARETSLPTGWLAAVIADLKR
jgi:hypothetical protein